VKRCVLLALMVGVPVVMTCCCTDKTKRYNVVLISVDTLRADALGCYGYLRETSPVIDRLAREGVRFQRVFSSTTWTLPAHIALLTAQPDSVHGVVWDNRRLDEHRITLAEMLNSHGYQTFGVFTAPYLQPRFGLAQGFDHYIDATLFDKQLEGPAVLEASERGRTTPGALEQVRDLLAGRTEAPFFLFLHLFDVHPDFDPPEPYRSMFDPDYTGSMTGKNVFHNSAIDKSMPDADLYHLRALYDGEIRYVDRHGVGGVLDLLAATGELESSIIVVTSDHGEEFFEHGEFGHRKNLHDTTLRIPLVLWCPDLLPAGTVVDKPVRIIDIMPTILDALSLPQSPEGLGTSLLPLVEGGGEDLGVLYDYAEIIGGSLHLEAIRAGDEKVIVDFHKRSWSYFDLSKDPQEREPIRSASIPEARRAFQTFSKIRRSLLQFGESLPWGEQQPVEIDEELRDHLRSLGYID
jgi:arylsulfatase A-like enzyme